MSLVTDLSNAIIWLLRVGVAFRVAYCFFRMISSEEEGAMYKKRAKNAVIFYIIAESIWTIKILLIDHYYKGVGL